MAKCASCGKEVKKKIFWRKGKPYCSLECADTVKQYCFAVKKLNKKLDSRGKN
ncbi:hypothetical protein KAW55_07040 [bacterium]|nr:hypothetical protein [bacterium]